MNVLLASTLALILTQSARNCDPHSDNHRIAISRQKSPLYRCKLAFLGWHHSWPVLLASFLWLTQHSVFSVKAATLLSPYSSKPGDSGRRMAAEYLLKAPIAIQLRQYCYQRISRFLERTTRIHGCIEYSEPPQDAVCFTAETRFRHCLDEQQWNGWFLRRADLDDAPLRRRMIDLHQRILDNSATLPELYAVIADSDDPYLEFSSNLLKALGLFFAARYGSAHSLGALLTAGARPSWRNAQGQTPAMVASLYGHDLCAGLLKLAESTHTLTI